VQDRCLALCHEPIQLDSLEKRRNDSDMCDTYKILNNKFKINPDSLFQRPTRELLGYQLKLHKVQVNTNVAKNFFAHRVVDSWNIVSDKTVSAPSIGSCKKNLGVTPNGQSD